MHCKVVQSQLCPTPTAERNRLYGETGQRSRPAAVRRLTVLPHIVELASSGRGPSRYTPRAEVHLRYICALPAGTRAGEVSASVAAGRCRRTACRFRLTLPRGNLAPSGAGTAPKTAGCGRTDIKPGVPEAGTPSSRLPRRHDPALRRAYSRNMPPARPVRGCPWKSRRCAPTVMGTNPVRYTSVDTATQRPAALQDDTPRDREQTARIAENSQLAGRFRRWWQVLGSNQRRLSRRFYRPLSFYPSQTR